MVSELTAQIKRRKKFSKRATLPDEADPSFINQRNHMFNRKLARSFQAATAELKANVERRTATD
jgi:hypothetical protein